MKRKLLTTLLCTILCFSLTGCSKNQDSSTSNVISNSLSSLKGNKFTPIPVTLNGMEFKVNDAYILDDDLVVFDINAEEKLSSIDAHDFKILCTIIGESKTDDTIYSVCDDVDYLRLNLSSNNQKLLDLPIYIPNEFDQKLVLSNVLTEYIDTYKLTFTFVTAKTEEVLDTVTFSIDKSKFNTMSIDEYTNKHYDKVFSLITEELQPGSTITDEESGLTAVIKNIDLTRQDINLSSTFNSYTNCINGITMDITNNSDEVRTMYPSISIVHGNSVLCNNISYSIYETPQGYSLDRLSPGETKTVTLKYTSKFETFTQFPKTYENYVCHFVLDDTLKRFKINVKSLLDGIEKNDFI